MSLLKRVHSYLEIVSNGITLESNKQAHKNDNSLKQATILFIPVIFIVFYIIIPFRVIIIIFLWKKYYQIKFLLKTSPKEAKQSKRYNKTKK